MTTEAKNIVPIEDLMDASIDDLKDLPPFIVPPVGHYKLQVSLERKVVNTHPCVEAQFVVQETLELKNLAEAPVENGTKFSTLYTMDNEFGQGNFKLFLAPLLEGLGLQGKKVSEVVASVKNVVIAATVKQRPDKEDKDKIYANVVNAELL
jgi:hypothetical protein